MSKRIGLQQLAAKKYILIDDLDEKFKSSLGNIEDAFDMLIHGTSGSGKSNFSAELIIALAEALKCRVEYVSFEEGHALTTQENFITRHNMFERLGNSMMVTDHYTFEEFEKEMGKKRSAKIWVIDSLQASHFTADQIAHLKSKYVLGRKRKILIMVSWSEGKLPHGASAKAVEYYANIKIRVEGYIAFIRSRYGGNKNYTIWDEGAKKHWGMKLYKKHQNR